VTPSPTLAKPLPDTPPRANLFAGWHLWYAQRQKQIRQGGVGEGGLARVEEGVAESGYFAAFPTLAIHSGQVARVVARVDGLGQSQGRDQ